jgi:hypothetical protein
MILNSDIQKERVKHLFLLSKETTCQGNQIVCMKKFLFIEAFQQIKHGKIRMLSFCSPNELMHLDNECQWLLTPQEKDNNVDR